MRLGQATAAAGSDEDARGWFAAYLGRFPQGAAVVRWELRDLASARWPEAEDRRAAQLHHRKEGRGSSSKGRRSSHKLADDLRSLEELGLIRRDNSRDSVIITDPLGLRRLAAPPARPAPLKGHRHDPPGRRRQPGHAWSAAGRPGRRRPKPGGPRQGRLRRVRLLLPRACHQARRLPSPDEHQSQRQPSEGSMSALQFRRRSRRVLPLPQIACTSCHRSRS